MKHKGASAPRGAGWWLLVALAGAGAIFLGWQAIKAAAVGALVRANPYAVSAIAPDDSRVRFGIAMTEFGLRGGRVSERSKRNAIAAANDDPLAEEPFILAAVDALVRNDRALAERLLLAARARDPRSVISRILLLDHYLRTNRIVEATQEISAIAGVAPRAGSLLMGELARLAQNPETRGALESAMRKNPTYRDRLLEHLAEKNADPNLILQIASNVRAPPGAKGPAPWQGRLVTSIAAKGEVSRAYQLWRTFYAPNAPEKKAGIYDAQLQGLPGGGPFGWDFPASPAGVAERTAARTIQVDFYGRDRAELVNQLLMLAPGRYRLSVKAAGDAEGEGSKLSWVVQCQPSNAQIADLALRKLTYAPRVFAGTLTVPATGCASQWLRLIGTAGEFPKAQSATISAISIEAAR